jgi:acetate---CoA ligase (ADP-forming)
VTRQEALRRLFWPNAVAVVGASPTQVWTRHMLPSLQRLGYRGDVFLVNPRHGSVDGAKCYPSIQALPMTPDAVIVVVRRELAITVVEECEKCGVGGAVVLTGGFAEAGADGRALEQRLCNAAKRSGMALLGPNCQGFINCLQPSALWMDEIFEPLHAGGVAIISHSGSVSTGIMNHLYRRGIYTNYTISLGNESDVTAAELIDAFVHDPQVRIIAAYLETIRDPKVFLAACDRAAQAEKPVVVMKVGRNPQAAEAIHAHTGALAGPDRLIGAQFRRHRVIRVQSLGEMVETCIALSGRRLTSPRLHAFASSGGHIELVVDAAASTALRFPEFSVETAVKLCERMPEYRTPVAKNPFDTGGIQLEPVVDTIAADPDIDAVMFITNTRRHPTGVMHPMNRLLDMAERLHDESDKPIIVMAANDDVEPSVGTRLGPRGIPLIGGTEVGLRALENVFLYSRPQLPEVPPIALDVPALQARLKDLDQPLAGREALDLVAALGVTTVRSVAVDRAEDAVAVAQQLGYPVVVKTGARDVLHKTETGQVFLNLATDDSVLRAACAVRPPILIQPHVSGGLELILGLQSDREMGTCVTVGMGGVLAELLDMIVLRPVPLRANEALEMLAELPFERLLDGYRGSASLDRAPITAIIERIAAFGVAFGPLIRSLDLNPVVVSPRAAFAVDALVLPWSAGGPA